MMSRSLIIAAFAVCGIFQAYGATLTLTILDEIYERENNKASYKTCHPTGTLEGAEAFHAFNNLDLIGPLIDEESGWGTEQWVGYKAVELFQEQLRDLWKEGNVIQVTYTAQGKEPQSYDISDTFSVTLIGLTTQVVGSELSADIWIDTDCSDWNLLGSIFDSFKTKGVVQFVLESYYQETSGSLMFKSVQVVQQKVLPGETISITTSKFD